MYMSFEDNVTFIIQIILYFTHIMFVFLYSNQLEYSSVKLVFNGLLISGKKLDIVFPIAKYAADGLNMSLP